MEIFFFDFWVSLHVHVSFCFLLRQIRRRSTRPSYTILQSRTSSYFFPQSSYVDHKHLFHLNGSRDSLLFEEDQLGPEHFCINSNSSSVFLVSFVRAAHTAMKRYIFPATLLWAWPTKFRAKRCERSLKTSDKCGPRQINSWSQLRRGPAEKGNKWDVKMNGKYANNRRNLIGGIPRDWVGFIYL
jgi:hypothetical protein